MKIISFVGQKGGSGKTTASHLLAHGCGLNGIKSANVITDVKRIPLKQEGRKYAIIDCRDPDSLFKVVTEAKKRPDDMVLIIDGGGNREQIDAWISDHSDLVILPFRDSPEDIRTVAIDLLQLPKAVALPNQWPTNLKAREVADQFAKPLRDNFPNRMLMPLPAAHAMIEILQEHFSGLQNNVNNIAKVFAIRTLEKVGFDFDSKAGRLVYKGNQAPEAAT